MTHIRIIRSRAYKYTTRWNKNTRKVENVYQGAVNPIRTPKWQKKKEPEPVVNASDYLSKAKKERDKAVKATLKQLGYTKI